MTVTTRIGGLLASALALCLVTSSLALAAPGDRDPHFGNSGLSTINMGGYDHMIDMALDGDKVVALGRNFSFDTGSQDLAIARFNADGSTDTTFGGGDGIVITDLGANYDNPGAVAALPGGGYLVAASTDAGGTVWNSDMVLVRYTEDGEVDSTFGTSGVHRFDVFSIDSVGAMVIQPDGKIVLGGASGGPEYTFNAVRLHPDGSFDTNADGDPTVHFSTDGKAFPDAGGYNQRVNAMALQPDGKIVMVGASGVNENGNAAMTRLNADGSVDTDFGTDGFVHVDESSTERFEDVAIQSDGRIVAVGGSYIGEAGLNAVIARYTTAGDPDTTFGDEGSILGPLGDSYWDDGANGVTIQPNGHIVVAGKATQNADTWSYLMRLDPTDGSPEPTFGNWMPGFSRFAVPVQHAFGDILMSGKRILVGGQTSDGPSDFYVYAVVAKMSPSKTTVKPGTRRQKVIAKGAVSPKHAGKKVKVVLQKKKDGRFVNVAGKRVTLNNKSAYRTEFKRPNANKCRLVTTFKGDGAHLPSKAKSAFAC